MNLTPEQIAAAQKANLETLSGLTNQALQSIEKLVELNLAIAKQSLSDSVNNAKKALEVKDIQQLLAHQAVYGLKLLTSIMVLTLQHIVAMQ